MMIRPTQAIVNLKAIAHNIRTLKQHVGAGVLFMAVVKANAYGHGIIPVAKTAITAGADWLGVALAEEAIELRHAGITQPILVLGSVATKGADQLVKHSISATVTTLESVLAMNKAAEAAGRDIAVHIKVDTGMGRIGLHPRDVLSFAEKVASLKNICIEGIFSHFASADEKDQGYSYRQLDEFKDVLASLESGRIQIPLKHFAGSAATIELPESYFDMVRPGISLYGIYPSNEVDHSIDLQPAMVLKTKIAFLKEMPTGAFISYGRKFVTKQKTMIATLPIGYADGYPRVLSNQGEVLVCGKRAPVVGRVCMDMTMIDVTSIPQAQVGTDVVLFGKQNGAEILVDSIAHKSGTISHEILCGITNRVPRHYINETY